MDTSLQKEKVLLQALSSVLDVIQTKPVKHFSLDAMLSQLYYAIIASEDANTIIRHVVIVADGIMSEVAEVTSEEKVTNSSSSSSSAKPKISSNKPAAKKLKFLVL